MKKNDHRSIGEWAESHIRTKLIEDGQCIVRDVRHQEDTGIDLYCETKFGNKYHFWIQVKYGNSQVKPKYKTIREFKTDKKNSILHKITFLGIEVEKIKYWIDQPVPVFLFGIPDKRKKDEIYYLDIHFWYQKNKKKIKKKQKWINISTEFDYITFGCAQLTAIDNFLDNIVPKANFRTYLYNGLIKPIDLSGLPKVILTGESFPHHKKLTHSIWLNSFIMANDIYDKFFYHEFNEKYFVDNEKKRQKFIRLTDLMLYVSKLDKTLYNSNTILFEGLKNLLLGNLDFGLEKIVQSISELKNEYHLKKIHKFHYVRKHDKKMRRLKKLLIYMSKQLPNFPDYKNLWK